MELTLQSLTKLLIGEIIIESYKICSLKTESALSYWNILESGVLYFQLPLAKKYYKSILNCDVIYNCLMI